MNCTVISSASLIFSGEQDDLSRAAHRFHLDSAKQKGTRWASIEALKQGVDISMITSACAARIMSTT